MSSTSAVSLFSPSDFFTQPLLPKELRRVQQRAVAMSLFAASLDTLKKRTTQLLDNLDKVKDGKGADGATLQENGLIRSDPGNQCGSEPSIEIPFDPQVASALGCPDDSILVRYEARPWILDL
eukprot:s2413_g29.t1